MERLVLDVAAAVTQQVHHQLEVIFVRHEAHHDGIVTAVDHELCEELDRLPLGHVVGRLEQLRECGKKLSAYTHMVVVLAQVLGGHAPVPHERLLHIYERVARHAKRRGLNVGMKAVKAVSTHALVRIEQRLGQALVLQHLTEHDARVERHLSVLVAAQRDKQRSRVPRDVLDGRQPRADTPLQEHHHDLHHDLTQLKLEPRHRDEQRLDKLQSVALLRKLRDLLGHRLAHWSA